MKRPYLTNIEWPNLVGSPASKPEERGVINVPPWGRIAVATQYDSMQKERVCRLYVENRFGEPGLSVVVNLDPAALDSLLPMLLDAQRKLKERA